MSIILNVHIKNHGYIRISLWKEMAPFAVESVIATAQKGIYNNKKIERLNGKFTVIGEVVDGWEEIERLENLLVDKFTDEISGFIYHAPKDNEFVERVEVEC